MMKYQVPLKIQAYEKLKEKILNGELEPDTFYSETSIGKELGISRAPARDALQRLAQEHYIEIVPYKGFKLSKTSKEDLLETYQIRSALEGFCVVQLAMDCNKQEAQDVINELEDLLNSQKAVIDSNGTVKEFAQYDNAFHEKIVDYVNNEVITDTFTAFHHQMKTQAEQSLEQEGRMQQTLEEHKKIIECIKKGLIGQSYEATLEHLSKPKGILESLF